METPESERFGRVDEVRILDRALTAEEIAAIYANSSVKYRNTFTFQNNTNLMFTLGYSVEQNTTSFSPSVNTLGFSGEVLACYSNDTEVLVREEVSREEFLKELNLELKELQRVERVKRAIQGEVPSKGKNQMTQRENSENFLEKIMEKIKEIIRERQREQ